MGELTITKPKVDLRAIFVPVIFANGTDDDSTGLQAAVDNEAVMFDDKVYQTDEALVIEGRELVVTRTVVATRKGRKITIRDCDFYNHTEHEFGIIARIPKK